MFCGVVLNNVPRRLVDELRPDPRLTLVDGCLLARDKPPHFLLNGISPHPSLIYIVERNPLWAAFRPLMWRGGVL